MVSVIIPVYNGEKFIKRCLDSVFSDPSVAQEVIAVNDGSRDASSDILHAYAETHPNLKVVDKENEGAARARQTGLEIATGDFIAFLDVDEWIEPGVYARLEEKAVSTGADIVFFDYVTEYSNCSETIQNRFDKNQTFPLTGQEAMSYLHRRRAVFPFPWNKIYRPSLLKQADFPVKNFVGEDYNMLLQLLEKAEKVEYLAEAGYHYVMTDNSASRSGYSDSTQLAYDHYCENYQKFCEKYPERKREITNYLITEYMACVIAMGRNQTYNGEMIGQIKRFVRKGLLGYVFAGYVPFLMKGSAIALSMSYRLLVWVYRILNQ